MLSVLFGLISVRILLDLGRENSRSGQNLIEVLELLSGFMLIRVRDSLSIDLCHVWEPINNESSYQNCVRHLVVFYR